MILNLSACTHTLFFRDIKKARANFAPTSVQPLLSPNGSAGGTTIGIISLAARPNGSLIVSATSGVTYSYDSSLCSFVKLSEPWWAEGSDAWLSRPRNASTQQAVVTSIESGISKRIASPPSIAQRPPWWASALTLGHLESKLHAARLLDSSVEYKQILLVYAKKIADEGFRNKAEELIKDLFGPIYWFVCFRCRESLLTQDLGDPVSIRKISGTQCFSDTGSEIFLKKCCQYSVSTTCLFSCCDAIEPSIACSKTLAKLGSDWQEKLKRAMASDD
jgi:protein HIRA/HIR1